MSAPLRVAVFGLLGLALGYWIDTGLMTWAGGTPTQTHHTAWICGFISMFGCMVIGAKP